MKLVSSWFGSNSALCDFVNRNGIKRTNIECIVSNGEGSYTLFWWR